MLPCPRFFDVTAFDVIGYLLVVVFLGQTFLLSFRIMEDGLKFQFYSSTLILNCLVKFGLRVQKLVNL